METLTGKGGPHVGTTDAAGNHTPKRVAFTTWETTNAPPKVVEVLQRFDAVIVPSNFCAGVIDMGNRWRMDGGHTYVVPHCFDEDWWDPPKAKSQPGLGDRYRFYTIGAWSERKNLLGVLRAYLHAFSRSDRVELVMIIDNPDFDEIKKTIALSGIESDQLPALHIPDTKLDDKQLLELHQGGHCFVSAHRGEGWGLGLFEAAISGKRIISPFWSGEVDFLHPYEHATPIAGDTVMRIHHQLTPCFGLARFNVRDGVARGVVGIPYGVTCKQLWADPNVAQIAQSMRAMYHSSDSRTDDEIRAGRQALEERFGLKVVGPQLASVLKEICDGKSATGTR